jgi:uncharacterized protein involved in exopolysaccharide biosynthesis
MSETQATHNKPIVLIEKLIRYLASHYISALAGSVVAAAIAFGVISFLPKYYQSVSAININDSVIRQPDTPPRSADSVIRQADSLMSTSFVLDDIISKFPTLQRASPEESRRELRNSFSWSVAPGDNRRTASLFFLHTSARTPAVAQGVNIALIDAWLNLTKPRPEHRERIENQIARSEVQIKSATALLLQLENEAPKVVSPNSLQGELASSLSALRKRRDDLVEDNAKLQLELRGLSRDVVVSPATLPTVHFWPKRGMTLVTAVGAYLLLWLAFFVARFQLGLRRD